MNNNYLPNLIIAGVPKGGTTSIFTYLADHPDVCASYRKEICYFMGIRFGRDLPPIEEYLRYFCHCSPSSAYRMEASPGYIYGGGLLAKCIKETIGKVKIIMVLRDPIKRFHSFFTSHQIKFKIDQDITFHEYIERCRGLSKGDCLNEKNYPYFQLANGCYDKFIPAWIDIFGDDLKIFFFEDLVNDSQMFMEDISNWMGIDPSFYYTYHFEIENKTKAVSSTSIHRVAMWADRFFEKHLRRHMRVKRYIRRIYFYLNGRPSDVLRQISEEDMTFLESYYAPHNDRLASILRKEGYENLPNWLN